MSSDADIVLSALRPPAARAGNVVRQALLDRLSEEAAAKLVAVVAPAGWGKTSLLRDWLTSGDTSSKAWLSVEPGDNDPTRFWAGVIAALNMAAPGIGSAALQMLAAPSAKTGRSVVSSVLNDLARLPKRITLIVDDFQLITSESTHAGFSFFAEHLPTTVGLVLASRSDPPLPLARLRARGQLAEIRADDMRLSAIEIRELLAGTFGLALTAADIDLLEQRTEGWAAGVYMAGSSLQGNEDVGGVIRTLAGENRQIMDYFAAEVLADQPAQVRSLLLRTSVLDRMTGPLCDAVTGSGESQAILESLEGSQLLVPLDSTRHWYRYHKLFADVLRRELDKSEPGLAPSLHRQASAWLRSHGLIADAISHAISAGDLADARDLLASHWNLLLHQGLSDTVDSLLNRLPVGMVIEDERMCLIRGYVACWLGHLDEVEPWLAAADLTKSGGPFADGLNTVESGACILTADYCHMTGDLGGAQAASERSMELQVPSNSWWRVMALTARGVNLFWRGQDADARTLLQQVVAPTTQLPVSDVCRCWAEGCLSAIALREGDVESTERHLQKAADLAARNRLGSYWMTTTATVTSADLLASRGMLAEAAQVASSALECARRGPARLETISALLCLARISTQAGSADDACMHLNEAKQLVAKCANPGILNELMTEAASLADQAVGSDGRALGFDGLSPREAQVLELVAGGNTNKEIAAALVVSVHTVERHLQNAYRKIGVRNRSDAAAYIVRREALASTPAG